MISRAGLAISVIAAPCGVLILLVVAMQSNAAIIFPFLISMAFVVCLLFGYLRAMLRR